MLSGREIKRVYKVAKEGTAEGMKMLIEKL
jgi:hypothetical protein